MGSRRFADLARQALEPSLEPGEALLGIAAASHQRTFSGQAYAVGVTEQRLILQPLDRKVRANGAAFVVTRETLASADVDGAGGGWWTAPAAILDAMAIALTVRTTDGRSLKLLMMNGGASSGGASQGDGVRALVAWIGRTMDER